MEKLNMQNIIRESSSPYLAAPKGYWINADGIEIAISEMGETYCERCLKLLENQEQGIKCGFFLDGLGCSDLEKSEIIDYALAVLEEKKRELSF